RLQQARDLLQGRDHEPSLPNQGHVLSSNHVPFPSGGRNPGGNSGSSSPAPSSPSRLGRSGRYRPDRRQRASASANQKPNRLFPPPVPAPCTFPPPPAPPSQRHSVASSGFASTAGHSAKISPRVSRPDAPSSTVRSTSQLPRYASSATSPSQR